MTKIFTVAEMFAQSPAVITVVATAGSNPAEGNDVLLLGFLHSLTMSVCVCVYGVCVCVCVGCVCVWGVCVVCGVCVV
jgi:hypothetical protein